MRCVAAVFVAILISVDSVPKGDGSDEAIGASTMAAMGSSGSPKTCRGRLRREVIGLGGLSVPTSANGKYNENVDVGLSPEGSLKVKKTKTTHTEEGSQDQKHDESNYDHADNTGDGSHTVSSSSQHDKEHSERQTKDETESQGFELGGGGLQATNEKTTTTDKKTHDSESGSTSFKKTDKDANSEHTEESGSNFKKEQDTHDKKTEHKKKDMSIGLGEKPKFKEQQDVQEEHDEHKAEEGEHFEHKKGLEKDGGRTTKTESGSGGKYKTAQDKSTKSSSHVSKEKTYENDDEGAANAKKGHHHHRHHQHIPHGVYQHLSQDSWKLGLTHGSEINGESQEYHAPPGIRQDYLHAISHKIHNAKVISAGHGNARIVSRHNSGEYSNVGPRSVDSRGSQYRTLSQKLGHSPVSSHYANAQIVEAKYGNLPSYYVSTDSEQKIYGTGSKGKLQYASGKSQYGTGNLQLTYRTQEGSADSQYGTANKQYDVGNLQLSPIEWEERARDNAENFNEQYSGQRNTIGNGIDGRRYAHGYVKKAYTIEPDVMKAILSQNVMKILKSHDEHDTETSKYVIAILNGNNGSAEKITIDPRTKQNKKISNFARDVAYSNDDNDIIGRSEDNIVDINSRYGKTEISNGATKYNHLKTNSVDSYGKIREPYDDTKQNNYNKEAFDSSNDNSSDSNDAAKYNDDKKNIETSITKFKDSRNSIYNDIKASSNSSNGSSYNEVTSENSFTAIGNNDSDFGQNINGNSISDINTNAAPKVKNDDENPDSITNSESYVNSDDIKSSTTSSPVHGISQATKSSSANNNATSGDLEKSNFNIEKADGNKEDDILIINSTNVDSEVKTKSEKYSQDVSDTDSVIMPTKSVSDRLDETNVKSTTEHIGFGMDNSYTSSGSDNIAKETSDMTTDHYFDSNSATTVSSITTGSSNATDTETTNISDAELTTESGTIIIDTTEKSVNSAGAISADISDDRSNSSNTTFATTILDLDTVSSYGSPNETSVFDLSNASGNWSDTETSEVLNGNSNVFQTNATLGPDKNNLYDTYNKSDLFDSSSDTTAIAITKTSENSTDTGTSKPDSGDVNDPNSDMTVISITKASDNSIDTGNTVISNSRSNGLDVTNVNKTSESDANSFDNSNPALAVTGLTKKSDNLTEIGTIDMPDVNSNYSNKTIAKTDKELGTGNNDSTSDTTVIRSTKALGEPVDTSFTDISDTNSNFSDSQNPLIATVLSDSGANNFTSDSTTPKIANASNETDSIVVPVVNTYSDSEPTNITSTTTVQAEPISSIDDVNNSYSEANATSMASVFDGSNNSTVTVEAYAGTNGSDSLSQAEAIADAEIDETGASSATAVANASSGPTLIGISDSISNNPSISNSEANATSTANAFDESNNSTAADEAPAISDNSDTSTQAIAIADANIDETGASSATAVANASRGPTLIGMSDSTSNNTNNPSISNSEANATSTANAFDESNNSTAADETPAISDDSDQAIALAAANIDKTGDSSDTAIANASSGLTSIGMSDSTSDDINKSPEAPTITANAVTDVGSSKDDASAPTSDADARSSGFSNDPNTAVTSDVSTSDLAASGSAKHSAAVNRALGDKTKTKKPLTVAKSKSRRRDPSSLVRDVDATESKSDENASVSDERPILTGVDSANTYDSGGSSNEEIV